MEHKHSYTPLAGFDPVAASENAVASEVHPRSWPVWLKALSVICFVILGIFIGIATTLLSARSFSSPEWSDCGNTTLEARQRGCTFDIMMNGWVTKECYNAELSESYLLEGDFRFFDDELGYREVPLDIVRLGEHKRIFTTPDHHLTHCAFMWRLQGLALSNGLPIDERSLDDAHTTHCAQRLLETHVLKETGSVGNGTRLPIQIITGFIACRSNRA